MAQHQRLYSMMLLMKMKATSIWVRAATINLEMLLESSIGLSKSKAVALPSIRFILIPQMLSALEGRIQKMTSMKVKKMKRKRMKKADKTMPTKMTLMTKTSEVISMTKRRTMIRWMEPRKVAMMATAVWTLVETQVLLVV